MLIRCEAAVSWTGTSARGGRTVAAGRRRVHHCAMERRPRRAGSARLLWIGACGACLLFWAAVLYVLVFR